MTGKGDGRSVSIPNLVVSCEFVLKTTHNWFRLLRVGKILRVLYSEVLSTEQRQYLTSRSVLMYSTDKIRIFFLGMMHFIYSWMFYRIIFLSRPVSLDNSYVYHICRSDYQITLTFLHIWPVSPVLTCTGRWRHYSNDTAYHSDSETSRSTSQGSPRLLRRRQVGSLASRMSRGLLTASERFLRSRDLMLRATGGTDPTCTSQPLRRGGRWGDVAGPSLLPFPGKRSLLGSRRDGGLCARKNTPTWLENTAEGIRLITDACTSRMRQSLAKHSTLPLPLLSTSLLNPEPAWAWTQLTTRTETKADSNARNSWFLQSTWDGDRTSES